MNLIESILQIYPTLQFNRDFVIEDHWNWPILTWLNEEIKQPTQSELDSAWIIVQQEQEIIKLKKQRSVDINNIATLSDQLNEIMETAFATIQFVAQDKPEILEVPAIKSWLQMRTDIRAILKK